MASDELAADVDDMDLQPEDAAMETIHDDSTATCDKHSG